MKALEIVGENKERDAQICNLFLYDDLTYEEIGSRFEITGSRVEQILSANRALISIDRDWETTKQILRVKKQIAKKGNSKKDVADLEDLLRKILDEGKPVIDQSQHLHITTIQEAIASAGSNNADRGKAKDLESARMLEE